jgi:hypothetical protein
MRKLYVAVLAAGLVLFPVYGSSLYYLGLATYGIGYVKTRRRRMAS